MQLILIFHSCVNNEIIVRKIDRHVTRQVLNSTHPLAPQNNFLVPVLLITLINTPKLNKIVSQIRRTQDGSFHLHQLCWAGERGKNLLIKICHLVSKWHYGSCFCSLGAFIGHWGWMMVMKMKIYAIVDLPVFFSDFLSTFCIFKALLKYSASL